MSIKWIYFKHLHKGVLLIIYTSNGNRENQILYILKPLLDSQAISDYL